MLPATLPSLAASAGVIGALGRLRRPRPRRRRACRHAASPEPCPARSSGGGRPATPRSWALLALAASALFDHVVRDLEAGATAFEPLLDESVEPEWIGPTVSGGPGSHVPWATLGREGRRHAFAHVRAAPSDYRPPGVPDLASPP